MDGLNVGKRYIIHTSIGSVIFDVIGGPVPLKVIIYNPDGTSEEKSAHTPSDIVTPQAMIAYPAEYNGPIPGQ